MNKKAYETPVIKELGKLTDITKGNWMGDNADSNYDEMRPTLMFAS